MFFIHYLAFALCDAGQQARAAGAARARALGQWGGLWLRSPVLKLVIEVLLGVLDLLV